MSCSKPKNKVIIVCGPTGAPGPGGGKGPQGDPGPDGPPGNKGDKGIPGPKGDTGMPGNPTGAKGPTGDDGHTGAPGITGQKGPQGDDGPTGDKGNTGAVGPTGDPGDTGSKGPKGDPGSTGNKGPTGARGDTGSPGPTGSKGQKGDMGNTGAKGPIGASGARGATGQPGDTGLPGVTGPPGPGATTKIKTVSNSALRTFEATLGANTGGTNVTWDIDPFTISDYSPTIREMALYFSANTLVTYTGTGDPPIEIIFGISTIPPISSLNRNIYIPITSQVDANNLSSPILMAIGQQFLFSSTLPISPPITINCNVKINFAVNTSDPTNTTVTIPFVDYTNITITAVYFGV